MAGLDSKFDSKCRELLKILPELQCFKCKDVPSQDQNNRYICVNKSHNLCEKDKAQCPCGSNVGKSPSPLIAKLLQDLPWMCNNFKSGCREIKEKTEELKKHQKVCIYRQIFCPGLPCKEKLLFLDVEYHLATAHKNIIEIKVDYEPDKKPNSQPGTAKYKVLKWNCRYNSNFEQSELTWGLYKITTSDGDTFFQSAYFNNFTFYTWICFFGSTDVKKVNKCDIRVTSKMREEFIYRGGPVHRLDNDRDAIIRADLTFKMGLSAAKRSLDENGNLNVEAIVFKTIKEVKDKNVETSSNINSTTGCEEQIVTGPAASSLTSPDTNPAPSTSGLAKIKTNTTQPPFNLKIKEEIKEKIKEEIKVEVKKEILDGFSIEEQSALEIVETLPMPKKQKLAK